MDRFHVSGTEFLVFYLGLATATLTLVILRRRHFEPHDLCAAPLRDPLKIAYLRDSPLGATSLVALTLLERRLIREDGERFYLSAAAPPAPLNPIEEVLLNRCARTCPMVDLAIDGRITEYFAACERWMADHGMMPNREHWRARIIAGAVAVLMLGVVAFGFIGTIRSVTPTTVTVLWFWILATWAILWQSWRLRTVRGELVLRALKAEIPRISARPEDLEDGSDAAAAKLLLIGAVHGFSALPDAVRRRHERALPNGILPIRPGVDIEIVNLNH